MSDYDPNGSPFGPTPPAPASGGSSGKAIASMVLGIVSLALFCFWYLAIPCAIVGLVLGVLSMKKKENGHGMAVAGVVMSIVAVAIAVILVILVAVGVSMFSNMDWSSFG